MIEKLRIQISRVFVVFLIVLICVSESLWEYKAPFVATVLFLVGTIMVGIGSLGRLWCSVYIAGYKTNHLMSEQNIKEIFRYPPFFRRLHILHPHYLR